MEIEKNDSSNASSGGSMPTPVTPHTESPNSTSKFSASGFSSWAKNFKFSQTSQDNTESSDGKISPFSRLASGLGIRASSSIPVVDKPAHEGSQPVSMQEGTFGTFTKGFLDTSKNAMRAVQLKARHMVSQNKIRYQDDGFDLDLTYITENIIAMGFPAGDFSSGILGYVEGFYRNHMEEVIKFFETRHKGRYKVYNLCSERLYDASLFEGKVACFPFDDHNCPPIQLISLFCQSAYMWLKEDIENVVVVHCKAGMARTGLMISSLLLYLKFYPTAEESIAYYNSKRCVDGKALVLPSQIRYVKYFERVLTYFNGEVQPGRRCILRGFRLHKCPYWVRPSITVSDHNGVLFSTKKHPRTKDMMPEDFWFSAPRKGIMVFALPGERGLAELCGDFKVYFHDRHGDFYCWLNTSMMENRQLLDSSELDWFDKRKLPCPGFQFEVVVMDADAEIAPAPQVNVTSGNSGASLPVEHSNQTRSDVDRANEVSTSAEDKKGQEGDDIFSDSEGENDGYSKRGEKRSSQNKEAGVLPTESPENAKLTEKDNLGNVIKSIDTSCQISSKTELNKKETSATKDHDTSQGESHIVKGDRDVVDSSQETSKSNAVAENDFKAIAADASVFTFGDEEDYESE
eukprot:TRINITY_DN1654_c0_g1_i1.p1 TRINITY_DN1654_c0_g1~~TRINITY_DN1654_c0_g1_i1.p1  ORF type:complete len:630 (-),score=131.28 TRINITY_DN1654_c0_g1_i1:233-2122(-)